MNENTEHGAKKPLKVTAPEADTTGESGFRRRLGQEGRAVTHPNRALGPSSFSISREGGTVVVTIRASTGSGDWAGIEAVLRDLIDAQGNLDVVLDLGEVDALEGPAAPVIVKAAHEAHRHGGRLRLADRACRSRSWH